MPEQITIRVNGRDISVTSATSVAVAMHMAGAHCRRSVHGEFRGPLCGMGICFECRADVNGRPHQRTCQILCSAGMQVRTNE